MKRIISIALLLSLNFFSNNSEGNSSERYSDVYKKYMDAECPIGEDNIKHFVYFAREREAIHDHPFLKNSRFKGAQIMYSWAELEESKGHYDFSIIEEDYVYLKSKGRKLFIQLQDSTFNPKYRGVPKYLDAIEYDGGSVLKLNEEGDPSGWVARRWNRNVHAQFAKLINALGAEFDGKIEGINLQESAIGYTPENNDDFTPSVYVESLKRNMLTLKKAFPESTTMQYANFMPGEWLPWEDEGYLKSIYEYGEEIGVGLGSPDLMVQRKGQLNHPLAMMHENDFSVPMGIAIQDGNYIGQTGESVLKKDRENIVPMLHAFAKDFLNVQYMFWVNEHPYFEEDVLPCFVPID